MIIETIGNLLTDVKSQLDVCKIIVHGCNCQGAMGAGFALGIKNMYPGAYESYRLEYTTNGLRLGESTWFDNNDNIIIVNANTQDYYSRTSNVVSVDYNAVRKCFRDINDEALKILGTNIVMPSISDIADCDIKITEVQIHFPLIGCGLAGGNWKIVSQIIDEEIDDCVKKYLWKLK